MHKEVVLKEPDAFIFSSKYKAIALIMFLVGALGFAYALMTSPQRAWEAYLLSFFYFMSVSLASLFFLALQHLTKAQWSVNIRRMFEALAAFIPYGLVFMLVLLLGGSSLYKWLNPEIVAGDALLQHKSAYLNQTFFLIRIGVFFLGWLFFSKKIIGNSLKQDKEKDDSLILNMIPFCVLFIMFYALSFSFFSVDLLMSLEPHWFSTIFGIYTFSGAMQTFFALVILLTLFICKKGLFNGMVSLDHIHDLGKFLLGFTIFWAYIAYSQYMLIWYANLPEETIFFYHRSQGAWAALSLALLVIKFIVPFLMLLPRWAKRTPKYLVAVCSIVIVSQFIDLYWLIYPNFDEHHVKISLIEISIFIGFAGVYLFSVFYFLSKNKLIPTSDPRIKNSAAHTVTY